MAQYANRAGADPACDPATQVRMPHYTYGVTGSALRAPITMVDPALVAAAVDEKAHVPLGPTLEEVLREDPPPDVSMNPDEPVCVGATFSHEMFADGSTKATEVAKTPGGCDPAQHFNITNTLAAGAAILSAVKRTALMPDTVTVGTQWRQNSVVAHLASRPRMFIPCNVASQSTGVAKLPVGALMYVHGCVLLRDPKCPPQVDTGYLGGVYAFHVGHGVVATCLRGKDVSPDHDTWAATWVQLPYEKLCARLRKVTENRMAALGIQVQPPFAATFDVSGTTYTVHDPYAVQGATSAYELWAPRRPYKSPAPRQQALMDDPQVDDKMPPEAPAEPEPEATPPPAPAAEHGVPPEELPTAPEVDQPAAELERADKEPVITERAVTPRRQLPAEPNGVRGVWRAWHALTPAQKSAMYSALEDEMDRGPVYDDGAPAATW